MANFNIVFGGMPAAGSLLFGASVFLSGCLAEAPLGIEGWVVEGDGNGSEFVSGPLGVTPDATPIRNAKVELWAEDSKTRLDACQATEGYFAVGTMVWFPNRHRDVVLVVTADGHHSLRRQFTLEAGRGSHPTGIARLVKRPGEVPASTRDAIILTHSESCLSPTEGEFPTGPTLMCSQPQ